MRLRRSLATAALAASVIGGVSAADAGTVFFDNFNQYAFALNWVPPTKWAVADGSVDIHGAGTPFALLPASYGKFVDLNGSTEQAGALETTEWFGPGSYTLSFLLSGNQRGDVSKTTKVTLGDWSTTITLASSAAPKLYTFDITTTGGYLEFADFSGFARSSNGGNMNKGNLLDDVTLSTPVPELSTWAMLGFGFSGIGYAMMRRRKTPIALA